MASVCTKTFTIEQTAPPGNTPCDLNTAGAGDMGNVVPAIGSGGSSWGAMPAGNYTITYLDGAYMDDDNPCPGEWKFDFNTFATWDSGSTTAQWLMGFASPCDPADQAAVALGVKAIRETLDFDHDGGTIGITNTVYSPTNLVNGSPNPTFQLTQNCVYPTLPSQVRIVSFDALAFDTCPGQPAGGATPWDGTFPTAILNPDCAVLSQFYVWDQLGAMNQLNGQFMDFAEIDFIPDGTAPTTTGCGWRLTIFLTSDNLWVGYKGVGTDPTGEYTRDSGCSAIPATLTVESY